MHSILLYIYSLLFSSVALLLRILAPLHPRLKAQLAARGCVAQLAPSIAIERARFRHCAVFFCSSAGEFEQAKPLISRLTAMARFMFRLSFFLSPDWPLPKRVVRRYPVALVPLPIPRLLGVGYFRRSARLSPVLSAMNYGPVFLAPPSASANFI